MLNVITNPVLKKIWEDRYQKNDETLDDNYRRVAKYIAFNSDEEQEFYNVMANGFFFPAGRTMSNAGIGKNLTLNNCFVYPIIEDSMDGIFEAVKSGALTHKAGGGIGYEFSLLRPNGSITSNDAIASGVVSFMDVFNAQTATVMQGSRRGANMGVLSIYHPDIEEFIDAKSNDKNKLNHFNLSIMVDDKFMYAVERNEKIYLHYPVYDEKYNIVEDKAQWKQYKEIDANYLWDKIMKSAYDNGEPGIMFYDNMNKNNNTWYTETITHSNPCSEYLAGTVFGQELPSNQYAGACNLGSLMLHNFVENPFTSNAYFHFSKLQNVIKTAVRMLDNIIDINNFPLPQYENYQKNFRTIGLGVTGLADALVMLGYRYNSQEAIEFVDTLMESISICAYYSSIELSKEKGPFPFLDAEKFIKGGFITTHKYGKNGESWKEIANLIEEYGIRNARILSIAPCGTMSLTFGNNCSSGIEPIFSLGYDRKVKIGGQNSENEQTIHINDYAYGMYNEGNYNLKPPFITAQEMSVDDHINMLATIAKHVDMSVSKTINVPTDYSFEDTKDIYKKCWKYGVKGCTIFRPNAIRQGILIDNSNKDKDVGLTDNNDKSNELPRGFIIDASDNLVGKKRKLITGCGSLHCEAFFDPITGDLMETFLSKGSTGGCNNSLIGLSRMISLAARAGCDAKSIVDQLDSCGVCPSYAVRKATKHDTSKGSCCPMAVGNALMDMWNEMQSEIKDNEEEIDTEETTVSVDNTPMQTATVINALCPECGEPITFEGGCNICKNCGWSKCN